MRESCATGLWAAPGVPHKGWECLGVSEIEGDELSVCEMCQVAEIRFIHHMRHEDYWEELNVGCVCAGHMAEEYDARGAEREARNASKRRRTLSRLTWRESRWGNHWARTRDGYVLIVFARDLVTRVDYGYCLKEDGVDEPLNVESGFDSRDEAQREAFQALESARG